MVILLQLCLFIIAVAIRGRFLFGRHLKSKPELGPSAYEYRSTSNQSVLSLHIGIAQNSGIPFIIRRERWYHRLLKAIGIADEMHFNDDAFDRHYFIITDFPNQLEQARNAGALIEPLRQLFALPVKSLHVTRDKIWCVIQRADREKDDAYFAQHRNILEHISKAIATANDSTSAQPIVRHAALSFGVICAHAGLLSLGVLGILSTFADSIEITDSSEWLAKAFLFAAFLAVGWFSAIITALRGSSWVCWVMADFLLCGLVGIFLSSIFIIRDYNIEGPQPSPQIYSQRVISKNCVIECRKSCGKRCTRRSSHRISAEQCTAQQRSATMQYWMQQDSICGYNAHYDYGIRVEHWKSPQQIYDFNANSTLYDSTVIGQTLKLPVNAGAANIQWLDITQIHP